MDRVPFEDVGVFEGPLFMAPSEDGPVAVCKYHVMVRINGTDYLHPYGFDYRSYAEQAVRKAQEVGTVDLSLWIKQEPPMSLEERFDLYAEREQEVRMGLRIEDGMYDGIPYR